MGKAEHSLAGHWSFLWAERVIAGILTLAVGTRMILSSSITRIGTNKDYFRSPEMVFDLIAIIPFWVGFFVPVEYLSAVRSCRVLRLLMFYRVSPTAHKIVGNLIEQAQVIKVVTCITMITVLFGATVMHEVEQAAQPDAFGTMFASVWWCVVTLTTVGYGDVSPVTPLGQLITMMLMLVSIGIVGALIGIIGSAFSEVNNEHN